MKFHLSYLKNPGKYIVLLGLVCTCHAANAQSTRRYAQPPRQRTVTNITDTTHMRRGGIVRGTGANTIVIQGLQYTSVDTVYDLKPFLLQKASCDFEKNIDAGGCVIVKYTDGFTKKICRGDVTEVITADGKKHVQHWMNSTRMYVAQLPPPPNPTPADVSYKWLCGYRDSLLSDIKGALSNRQDDILHYTAIENADCKGNLYKQIEYRTIFLEQFLKAK